MQFNFGTLINSILVAMIIFYVYFYPKIRAARGQDRRKLLPTNPHDKPGKATECLEHMKKLTELETEVNNIKTEITEIKTNNRDDHREIFSEINKIRNSRR